MAFTIQDTGFNILADTTIDVTINVASGGALFVLVQMRGSNSDWVSSVVLDPAGNNEALSQRLNSAATSNHRSYVYDILNPTAGTSLTLRVSTSNANAFYFVTVVSVTADDSISYDTSGTAEGTSATPTDSIDPTTQPVVILASANSEANSQGTGLGGWETATINDSDEGSWIAMSGYLNTTSDASVTTDFSTTQSDDWQVVNAAWTAEGAAGITITGNAGALSLTGQQGSIDAPVTIDGNLGSLSLTGQQASIQSDVKVDANLGSLTLSGQTGNIYSGQGELFHITHEGGNLGEYTSTVGTVSASTDAGIYGDYGLDVDCVTGTTARYGANTISVSTQRLTFGFYIDTTNFTLTDGNALAVAKIFDGGSTRLARVLLEYDTGSTNPYWNIRATAYNDGGGSAGTTDAYFLKNWKGFVKVEIQRESSDGANDGFLRLYVDETLRETVSSVGNFNDFPLVDSIRLGIPDGSTLMSGNLYFDEFIFRDDFNDLNYNPLVDNFVGTLSLSGQQATISSQTLISGNLGSLTLSGQQGEITADIKLSTNLGSLTLTPQQGSIDAPISIDAAQGSVTLTGQQADIVATVPVNISGGLGTLTLSGQSASVFRGATLIAKTNVAGTGAQTTSGIDTTGADFLLVVLSTWEADSNFSDSKSNTWQSLTRYGDSTPYVQIKYVYNPTVGTNHTVSNTASYQVIAFYAFSGMDQTSGVFDAENGATDNANGQSGTITPAEAGELLVGAIANGGGDSSLSVNSPFTLEDHIPYSGGVNPGLGVALYNTYPNTNSIQVDFDNQYSANAVTIAAFKLASGVLINGSLGSLTLSGQQGNIKTSETISGSLGALTLTGQQGNIDAPITLSGNLGTLTLSGQTSSINAPITISGNLGSLTLTGLQATIDVPITISGNLGTLTLSGQTADIDAPITISSNLGTLTLSGQTSSINASINISGNLGTLTLTGFQATVDAPVTISGNIGTLTLSGLQGSLVPVTSVLANLGTLTLSGQTGSIDAPITLSANLGTLTLSGQQGIIDAPVTISSNLGSLTLSGQQGSINAPVSISGNLGTLTLTSQQGSIEAPISISTNLGTLSFTGQLASIDAPITISGNLGILTLTSQTASVDAPITITANFGTLTLTSQQGSVDAPITIDGSLGTLTLTGQTANVISIAGTVILGDLGSLSLSGQQASIDAPVTIDGNLGSLVLSGQQATLLAPITISGSLGSLTLTSQQGTIIAGVSISGSLGSLTLAGQIATVDAPISISSNLGTLTLSGQSANVNAGTVVNANLGILTISGQQATINIGIIISAATGLLNLSSQQADIIVPRIVNAGLGSLTLSGQRASISGAELILQVYTISLLCNITPDANMKTNNSPEIELNSMPIPSEEVYIE